LLKSPSARRRRGFMPFGLLALLVMVLAPATAGAQSRDARVQAQKAAALRAQLGVAEAARSGTRAVSAPSCTMTTPNYDLTQQTVYAGHSGYLETSCGPYDSQTGEGPQFTVTQRPSHGHMDFYIDSGYGWYTPTPGFQGDDQMKFKVTNPAGTSAEYTITIHVVPAPPVTGPTNYPPYCYSQFDGSWAVRKGTPRSGKVFCYDDDGETVSAAVVEQPQYGTVTLEATDQPGVFEFTYTMDADAPVDDQNVPPTPLGDFFVVRASDPSGTDTSGDSDAFVSVEDYPAGYNSAPICYGVDPQFPDDINAAVEADETVRVYDAGCYDPENDPITITIDDNGDHGTATVDTQDDYYQYYGAFVYDPVDSTPGGTVDSFTFHATDDQPADNTSDPATARVYIERVHANPTCPVQSVAVAFQTPTPFSFSCNDGTDGDTVYGGGLFSISATNFRTANHGDMDIGRMRQGTINGIYYPDAGFAGADEAGIYAYDTWDGSPDSKVNFLVAGPPPTPEQIAAAARAAAQQVINTEVMPKLLAAFVKAFKKKVKLNKAFKLKLGPYGTDVTIYFTIVSTTKGKAAYSSKTKKVVLGKAKLVLAKGKTGTLSFKWTKKGKALLKKKKKIKAGLTLTVTSPTGAAGSAKKAVTVRKK
jgi:hypothetical protein